MKKQWYFIPRCALICILFFLLVPQAHAQRTLQYGAKGGLNFATLFGDTYSNLGFRTGLAVGVWAETKWKTDKTLRAELYYSQEGARNGNYDFSSFSTVIYDQKLIYNYINLPVLVKFHLQGIEGLNLQAGLQLGVRLAAKENRRIKSGTPAPTDNSAGTRVFNQRIKLIYPSLTVGAGYPIADKLTGDVRFYYSPFDNVKKNAGDSEGTFPLIMQLTVSYQLGEVEK